MAFLREVSVVPDPAPSAGEGPLERLVEDYRRYLARERGVTQKTIKADNKLKQQAIERTAPTGTPPGRYQPPDTLLAFLERL